MVRMLQYLDLFFIYIIVIILLYKRSNQSKHGKTMEYLSSYFVECIFVVIFPGDFQILLYQQFELIMNTISANDLPTSKISDKFKNQDLMTSLQMYLDCTE